MSEVNNTPAAAAPEASEAPQENLENKEVETGSTESEVPAAEAKKSNKKKFQLQVNKKTKEVEIDLDNEEELKKHLQKAFGSDEKFEEASKRGKEADAIRAAALQFIEDLRTNPRKVLSDPAISVDLKKLAQEIMNEEIAEAEKTPEQKEMERLQKELKRLSEEREQEQTERQKREFERLQAEQEEKIQTDIGAALEIHKLPKTERTVKMMAEMMMVALQHDIDLSASDIAPIVKQNLNSDFFEVMSSLGDDDLEDFLGKEVISRIRKRNAAKAKQVVQTASQIKPSAEKKTDNSAKQKEKITISKWLQG